MSPTASLRRRRLGRAGRFLARSAAALVLLVALAGAGVYVGSARAFARPVAVPVHPAPAVAKWAATPAAHAALVARGAHVVATRGCTECHGATFGGAIVADDPLAGRLAGPNLTAGGRGAALDDRAWELALRHGVRPDGTPLLIMPSGDFATMTDEDVAAVVAYVRSLPAVQAPAPALRVGPLPRALYLAGAADVAPAQRMPQRAVHTATLAAEPTAAYGAYLVSTCTGCHHADLAGGAIPGVPPDWPPSRNITPHPTAGIGRWSEADFTRLLTTGIRPDGHLIDTLHMPVRVTRTMTDVERRALWAYLRTVPARGGARGA